MTPTYSRRSPANVKWTLRRYAIRAHQNVNRRNISKECSVVTLIDNHANC